MRLDVSAQRLREATGTSAGTRDAAFVVQRMPQNKRTRERLGGGWAALCRHPDERGLDLLLAEVAVDHLPVRTQNLRERLLPVHLRGLAKYKGLSDVERARCCQERFTDGSGEGRPVL